MEQKVREAFHRNRACVIVEIKHAGHGRGHGRLHDVHAEQVGVLLGILGLLVLLGLLQGLVRQEVAEIFFGHLRTTPEKDWQKNLRLQNKAVVGNMTLDNPRFPVQIKD